MLDRSHEPSISVTLASTPIMSMAFMDSAAALAAGGAAGAGGGSQAIAAAQQAAAQFLALGDSVRSAATWLSRAHIACRARLGQRR